jgi:ribosomal protein L11 methyltransferase
VEGELARLHDGPLPAFSLTGLAPQAWQSAPQPGFEPLYAGRFFVHDEAHSPDGPNGHICIQINPALAFGTGHHPTTAGCLIALEKALKSARPRTVLDLGCGTAILAIAAAKCLHRSVLATDIDPLAVTVARQNARSNAVAPLVRCAHADGLRGRLFRAAGPFDLVLANILAGPLIGLAEPLARATAPGSRLILSGLLTSQVRRVSARYRAAGFIVQDRLDIKEWATLTLIAPRPPRGEESS